MIVVMIWAAGVAGILATFTWGEIAGRRPARPLTVATLAEPMTRERARNLLKLQRDARARLCYAEIRAMERALLCPADNWHEDGVDSRCTCETVLTPQGKCGTACSVPGISYRGDRYIRHRNGQSIAF